MKSDKPAQVIGIKLKNFRAFRSVDLRDIPNFCVFVGENGVGKTTIFNIFQFLKEAMNTNITKALRKLGGAKGFQEVRTRGEKGNIEIEIKFRSFELKKNITYKLSIGEENGKAIIDREILEYRRAGKIKQRGGKPWQFLNFLRGKGYAVTNASEKIDDERELKREKYTLEEQDVLAIKGLAQFDKFLAVVEFGKIIENWYISNFHINLARRESQDSGEAEMISYTGDNLFTAADYLYHNHKDIFDKITEKLVQRIPNLKRVETSLTEDNRVLLKFFHKAFEKPILAPYISDGTLRMLAYLILLYHPTAHPLLGIEEPENQLYHSLLEELAEEFRNYADSKGGQVFVSTHSPDFLNALEIGEVFFLSKKKGYTEIIPATKNKQAQKYMDEGDKMGRLWKQGIFDNEL